MAHIELVSRTDTTITCRAVDLPDWAAGINWYIGLDTSSMPFNQSRDVSDTTWTFSRVEHPERPGTGFAMTDSTVYYVKFATYDSSGVRHDDLFPVQTDAYATEWVWGSWDSLGVPASEFNRFIALIYAVAEAKKVTLPGTASSFQVVSGTPMQASQFNAVVARLQILGEAVPEVSVGTVSPSSMANSTTFKRLVNNLYSIMDKLERPLD